MFITKHDQIQKLIFFFSISLFFLVSFLLFLLENAKHQHGNKNWRFSLEIFLAACSKYLDTADDCASDVIYLFEQFDKAQTRDVSGQVLRHLLHEAIAPTRLSRQETDEFMAYAEVGSLRSKVDYEALVDKLMF